MRTSWGRWALVGIRRTAESLTVDLHNGHCHVPNEHKEPLWNGRPRMLDCICLVLSPCMFDLQQETLHLKMGRQPLTSDLGQRPKVEKCLPESIAVKHQQCGEGMVDCFLLARSSVPEWQCQNRYLERPFSFSV